MRVALATFLAATLVAAVLCSPLPHERQRTNRAHATKTHKSSRPAAGYQVPEWSTGGRGPSVPREKAPQAIEDYQLPKAVRPLEYEIYLIPYLETPSNLNFTFDGSMTVKVHVDSPTDTIRLHAGYDLNILKDTIVVRRAGIIGGEVGVLLAIQSDPSDDRDFLTIQLLSVLDRDVEYELSMDFWGHINDDLEGFYRTFYTDNNGNQQWLAVTHFQTVSARRAFPCWDEPAWKAVFIMHIAHDPDHSVLGNMPVVSDDESVPGRPQWRYTLFEPTPVMSSYLIAYAVSDFEALVNSQDPRFKVWAAPGRSGEAAAANDAGRRITSWMEFFTGIPYMLPKMDQVAVPGFASGAMENWGLLTYRDDLMLLVDGVSGPQDEENTKAIVAHEVSHQWFGDLVSPKWWDNLWLNEGFARYFEYNALIDIETTWQMEERFVYEQMHYVFLDDSLNSTHPMFVEGVDSPYATYDMFDGISYSKGACIVRFMINLLGPSNFQSGINTYLNTLQYSNADMDDLWAALAPAVPPGTLPNGLSFKQVMDSWTLQAGFPVVRVIRDYGANSIFVTQKRFVTDVDAPYFELFMVPITLTTEAAPDFEDLRVWGWHTGTELTVGNIPASSSQWVIVNVKQTGYYRVNYDQTNWQLLAQGLQLRPRDFHQINRGQLINDALTLADSGELDYTTALAITGYLAQETDYMPWSTAKDSLAYVGLRMDNTVANRALYAAYMATRLAPVYNLVNGFTESGTDSHVTQLKRPVIVGWSCALDDSTCNADGYALFQQWMASPNNNPIPVALKSAAYCAGMRMGGTAEYNFLMERYAATNPSNYVEQETIETALGCSADTALLTRYLEDSINPNSVLKGRFCMYAVIDNWRGVDLALDFLIANWVAARETYGSYTGIERTFNYLGPNLNTAEQRQKLQTFLDDNYLTLLGARPGVENAIAILDKTLAWHATYGAEVVAYFQNNP